MLSRPSDEGKVNCVKDASVGRLVGRSVGRTVGRSAGSIGRSVGRIGRSERTGGHINGITESNTLRKKKRLFFTTRYKMAVPLPSETRKIQVFSKTVSSITHSFFLNIFFTLNVIFYTGPISERKGRHKRYLRLEFGHD